MSEAAFEAYRRNVRAYEAGALDGLACPRCGAPTAAVRFAPPPVGPDGPSTVYFACAVCGGLDTAQYRGEPPHFDPSRLL